MCESHGGLRREQRQIRMGLRSRTLTRMLPMPACHVSAVPSTLSALDKLNEVFARLGAGDVAGDFVVFEDELHALVMEVEREGLGKRLAALDMDAPAVVVGDEVYRKAVRCEGVYETRAGEVRVERTLYRTSASERCICPMELRAGMVEGRWTPGAASLAVWAVAHLTPQEAEELFARCGGMTPSRSSLDRLPKAVSARWEEQRTRFEECVRAVEEVPAAAVSVSVSLDGVMVPMKDGGRQRKRRRALRDGKETRGPAGFREAACGTLTLHDAEGNRLSTTVLGRMPERGKKTLKDTLEDELVAVLDRRPDLDIVGLADGARDNWTWLDRVLPEGSRQVLDFFHAAQHLERAMNAAHGEGTTKARSEFERLRLLLRDDEHGVSKVINALAYQRRRHPRREVLLRELRYFRRNRHRMGYAAAQAACVPIGSGVVEAANKTLVVVRMKRAGARWLLPGGQAVLTFRALAKSGRFDRAWDLLVGTYTEHIQPLSEVTRSPQRQAA
jgi:hypothetical protein